MRVLFVGAHLGKGGGVALQAFQLFVLLGSQLDIQFLCLDAPGAHSSLSAQPGVTVAGPLVFPKGVSVLRDALRAVRDEYDVFQILDPYYALPAAYLARVTPRVVNLGTDPRAEMGWRFGPHAGLLTRLAMGPLLSGGTLVANSRALAARFRPRTTHVIPNGVDVGRFERMPTKLEARRAKGLPEDRTLLGFVGKVIPVKRTEWLMEVARKLPDVTAVIVGGYREAFYGDRYYRGLRAAYPDVGDRAIFTGEVPWTDVTDYLAAADIFVFPSRFEGLPNAVMEAMAAGLPVVASDIPPHRELIEHGRTGFLASDPASMARLVADLKEDEGLRSKVGGAARRYIQDHLTSEACGRAYIELYKAIVEDGSTSAPADARRPRFHWGNHPQGPSVPRLANRGFAPPPGLPVAQHIRDRARNEPVTLRVDDRDITDR